MSVLRLEQLQPGMELEADVLDRNGHPLVRAGTIISDKDLRRFKMWGVAEVEVLGHEAEAEETAVQTIDPTIVEHCEHQARQMFRHADLTHPFVAQLYQEALIRMSRQYRGE
jgi:hypothetical protein